MSLNRSAQSVYDYIRQHPDEDRHWREKVHRLAVQAADPHAAAAAVTDALRAYAEERAGVVPLFRDLRQAGVMDRSTLRSLAELLVRLWGPPPKKKKPAPPGAG